MTFVRTAFFPGATQAQFDALAAALADVAVPDDRLLFAAGPVDGGWQVVQVWTSQAELDAFNRDHLLPALASLGPGSLPRPGAVVDFTAVQLDLASGG